MCVIPPSLFNSQLPPEGRAFYVSVSNPNANSIAALASRSLAGERCAMKAPRLALGIVWMLWKLTAQSLRRPSADVKAISEGVPLIVEVIGATVTLVRYLIAESRDKITTGRRLSGARNVNQYTSP